MINIIFSELYKIFRSKIFIVVSVILFLMFSVSISSSIYSGNQSGQLLTGISSYQGSYSGDIIYYIILIFTTTLITAEYSNGTIRQMACRGISRCKLVFGQYIAIYITITLVLLVFGTLNLLCDTILNQLGEVNLINFLIMNMGILCMFFGIVGIGTFISYLFKNGGVATAVSILFVISGNYFAQFLKLLTDNDIFIKYSLSNMRNIIIDLTSRVEDVFVCSIVFVLIGLISIICSSLLFSKRDVD